MADIKAGFKTAISFLMPLLGLAAAGVVFHWGFSALPLNWQLVAVLVFLSTKLLTDVVGYLLARSRQVFYVDDYLKEMLIYTLMVLIAIGAIHLARMHIGGEVWIPLLAAAMALSWRYTR